MYLMFDVYVWQPEIPGRHMSSHMSAAGADGSADAHVTLVMEIYA